VKHHVVFFFFLCTTEHTYIPSQAEDLAEESRGEDGGADGLDGPEDRDEQRALPAQAPRLERHARANRGPTEDDDPRDERGVDPRRPHAEEPPFQDEPQDGGERGARRGGGAAHGERHGEGGERGDELKKENVFFQLKGANKSKSFKSES
jgi:hypothetical protein